MTAFAFVARPGGRLAVAAIALFLLLVGAYTFSIGLRATRGASITGDEPFYLLTTQSLLDDGNLDLTAQYERESYRDFFDHAGGLWTQSIRTPNGQILSPHEPGLSILVIPGFVAGGLAGVQVQLILIAAATFALAFVLAALETGAARLSWLLTAAVGLTAPAFVYASEVYPEVPAAFCLVLALLLLRGRSKGWLKAAAMVAVLSALAWLGMKYVPLGCIVAATYLWRADGRRRAWFLGLAGISAVLYAWFHLAAFGALTAYNSNTVYEGASTASVLQSHIEFSERFYRLWGLFIDRRFGIGRWAPLLLLILPALPLLIRHVRPGRVIAALILVQLLMGTFVAITMMGWWFPGRTMMAVFPLFPVVLVAAVAQAPRWGQALIGVAAAYSIAITALLVRADATGAVTMAVDPFDMPGALFQAVAPLFPQYTSWGRETVILNTAWLTIGVTLLVASTLAALPPSWRAALSRWGGEGHAVGRTGGTVAKEEA